MSLIVIIVILIIFNNRAMKKIRDQEDIIDDLNITIENFPTIEQLKAEIKFNNRHKFKEEYLQLNINEIKG